MPIQSEILDKKNNSRTWVKIILAIIGLLLSVLYLLNITAGFFEFLPDNLPIVGNIDEAIMSSIFYGSLQYLGLDLLPFGRKPNR